MASKWNLYDTQFMKSFLLSIFLSFACSLAWSDSSRSLPPIPPPPNPGTVGGIGLPPLYLSSGTIKPLLSQGLTGNTLDFLKFVDINTASPSIPLTIPSGSWQYPKPIESSIQGLQFIKPSPF